MEFHINLTKLLMVISLIELWNHPFAKADTQCPGKCTCINRRVQCLRLLIRTIPQLPRDTAIVDLRFNRIQTIPSNAFGSETLHTIMLDENHISTIESRAFSGLQRLKYLFLNKNRISKIASDAFIGLDSLESLYLNDNELAHFDAETFTNLPRLQKLYLYNNRISRILDGSFDNLPSLRQLHLNNNSIQCDCSIVWLIKQLNRPNKRYQSWIKCAGPPKFARRDVQNININDLNCHLPEIMDGPKNIEILIGERAYLNCHAIGDPTPKIIWMQNSNEIPTEDGRYQLLPNGTLIMEGFDESYIGQYECMAKNMLGVARSERAEISMKHESLDYSNDDNPPNTVDSRRTGGTIPKIVLSPFSLTVSPNEQIILHCVAAGAPDPVISWYFNERAIAQSTDTIRVHSNGTLIIQNPQLNDAGRYRCEAVNYLGHDTATADIKVNVHPEIVVSPENQTLKIGSKLTLRCEASGTPKPKIWWERNGKPLAETNRIFFAGDNTELHINEIKETDSGRYVCVAENHIGAIEVEANIEVTNNHSRPKFIFEPYDIEALPGSTIELPCQGEGEPIPQIKWRKDGKTLIPSAKHKISPKGNLYIKKVTDADVGRYECSIKNIYGSESASGLVTVSHNEGPSPDDQFVRIAYAEASNEIDRAINQTIASLFGKNRSTAPNPSELFQLFRYPNAPNRELARAAEIYERTLVNIRKHIDKGSMLMADASEYNYTQILSPAHLDLVAQLSGCAAHRLMPNCTRNMCYHLKYRSIDGTCNNLQNPTWGASLTGFRRILKPIYENGFSMPIGWTKGKLYHGFPKPSARLVSTTVISTNTITPDDTITHMVMQWGQFLDHDLDHALPSVSSESWDGIDCKKTCEYAAPCYPIEVPPNDPRIHNRRCIDVTRTSAVCGSGMTSVFFRSIQPREQINQLTSYIDASQVYGYSAEFARELRNLTTDVGLLRTGVHFPNQKAMLPFAAPQDGIDCRRDVVESNVNCFVAGDIRVNEQIGLLAMHVLWMREHNRLAEELKDINPHWDGDTVYQEARKIVGAEMQHITYKHWLPNIVGPKGMEMLGEYREYDPTVYASISNEFATAALRFGHTLINPILHRLNSSFEPIPQGHLPLHKAFFAPWRLVHEGGIDPLLRGMFSVPAKLKRPTENLNTELTEKLFFTTHAVALDLAALNIQRSRDHAIPGYNEYRRECNMPMAETFDDLRNEITDQSVREKLKQLYGHPSNIDIFVGGILEDQVKGGRVGPLFRCLLVEQFKRLRDGDRHWYENPSTFKPEQLSQIKLASLGRVLCDNGDNITEVTDDVFYLPQVNGGYKDCNLIPKINSGTWLDCDKCSAHLDPTKERIDPTVLLRQRRDVTTRVRRDTSPNVFHSNLTMNVSDEKDIDNFIDMNEERVEGLESMLRNFQKTMKQLRKRIKKLEQTCNENGNGSNKGHGQCVDDAGVRRLNNEIWTKNSCIHCECKHHQINCVEEKCSKLYCPSDMTQSKKDGNCCSECVPIGTTTAVPMKAASAA